MRMTFKGPAARALDAWYSTGNVADNLTEARNLLQSPRDFTSIIATLSHGRPEFVYPMNASALRGPEFERVTRDGYLRAIDLAFGQNPPVPIRTTWETGAGNAGLEIESTNGTNCVEVTLRVPGVEVDAADAQRLGLTDVRPQD